MSDAKPLVAPAAVVGPGWVQIGNVRRDWNPTTAWHLIRIAFFAAQKQGVLLDHSAARESPPQIWLLAEKLEQLGLDMEPDGAYTAEQVVAAGSRADLDERGFAAKRVQRWLESSGFLDEAFSQGWRRRGESPARITLADGSARSGGLRLALVLEPLQWVSDTRETGVAAGLEAIDDPQVRAEVILRRLSTVDEWFGALPLSTPARMGVRILDQHQARARANAKRGNSTNKAGANTAPIVSEAGVVPGVDGRAGLQHHGANSATVGAGRLSPPLSWHRAPTSREVEEVEYVVQVDQRMAYPAACNNVLLGYGQPEWVEAEAAQELASQTVTRQAGQSPVFAMWRCHNERGWEEVFPDARMPAPHDDLRNPHAPAWVFPSQMALLLTEDDAEHAGAGLDVADLGVTGAWVWPAAGRMLEPLYRRIQPAWRHTAALYEHDPQDGHAGWFEGYLKSIGRATAGYLLSGYAREDADPQQANPRPWRYQPIWWDALAAAASARLWRQINQLRHWFDIQPVEVDSDAVIYLLPDGQAHQWLDAQQHDTRLGKLRIKNIALCLDGVAEWETNQQALHQLGGRRVSQVLSWHGDSDAQQAGV